MIKTWKKTNEGSYSLSADNNEIGIMNISHDSLERKAACFFDDKELVIKRTGFWKSTIEISNKAGQVISKVHPEKWYANSWSFDYKGKKYTIIVRNNPLAEWAILHISEEIAAYGLHTVNGKLNVKITTSSQGSDFLFDFLLWYLFLPIATENMDDSFTFVMLVNNQ